MITREIRPAAQVTGVPTPGHVAVAETGVDGEVLVRTELAAGDPVRSVTGWTEYAAGPAAAYDTFDPGLFPDLGPHLGQGPTASYGTAGIAAVGEGGIEDVPGAFLPLLQGAYRGNVLVRLS
ncbi:hypothetical protein PV371_17795 [Streptomyces sp. TX20-6-3]|uniref:hypothetical protein n=1 Tax=Streptomyces sp. TX20-6-3 TaxID=3028705 RepID=UPI0029BE0A84|nr:hypothetical protein [Streptomyces sp. TX20-6-3]MDX2561501.1 hypothetical protein [Streptomyces sp. TX20-6-3]